MKRLFDSFLVAVQFLTRLPIRRTGPFPLDALAQGAVFFPLVGLMIGAGAVLLHGVFSRAGRNAAAVIILSYLILVTGGMHEDALADAADGFGGGWSKDQILEIMRDSRIGSFGALAIFLALLARYVFLTSIPKPRFNGFLLAGQVLSRWTALPLGFLLPSAREQPGQGALVAGKITAASLTLGTALAVLILWIVLGRQVIWPLLAAITVAGLSAAYYHNQIAGVTGDCLGATNQITEIAVYLMAVVLP